MKKQVGIVAAVLVLAFVIGLEGADSNRIVVNVPFAFHAEGKSLPAGKYVIEIARLSQGSAMGSSLIIKSSDEKLQHRFVALPGTNNGLGTGARLVFNKYEGEYFLARVDSYGLQCNLRSSSLEKQVAAKLTRDRELVTALAE
jgi:hypothetical protein